MVKKSRGSTLMELMIVVAILGVVSMVVPDLYKQVRRFFFLSNARVDLQREARLAMATMTKSLRQAKTTTMSLNQIAGQPYYSRVQFTDVDSRTVSFYQQGKYLKMTSGATTKTLTSNLRYVAFAFPRSDDMGIISVALTLEKSTYQGRTKALHMASEKVRIMNE